MVKILIQTGGKHNTIYVCKYNHNTQHVVDNKKIPDLHTAVISDDAFSRTVTNSDKEERWVFRKMNLTATQLQEKSYFLITLVNYTTINLKRNFRIVFELRNKNKNQNKHASNRLLSTKWLVLSTET